MSLFRPVEHLFQHSKRLLHPDIPVFIDEARAAADEAVKRVYASGAEGQKIIRGPLRPPSSIDIRMEKSGLVFRITNIQNDGTPSFDWYVTGANAQKRHELFVLRHSPDEDDLSHQPVLLLGKSYRLDRLSPTSSTLPLERFYEVVWQEPEWDKLLRGIALEIITGQGNIKVPQVPTSRRPASQLVPHSGRI